jgi:branched-chain amino acid transport system permease protein
VSGAVLAGVVAPNGLNFNFLENILHINQSYATLIGGIGLILTAVRNPEGIAGTPRLLAQQRAQSAARKEAKRKQLEESESRAMGVEK